MGLLVFTRHPSGLSRDQVSADYTRNVKCKQVLSDVLNRKCTSCLAVAKSLCPSRSGTVGAPSLRSLQGRVRCSLYHVVCHSQAAPLQAFVVPALRKNAKDGAPRCVGRDGEIKSRATPPPHSRSKNQNSQSKFRPLASHGTPWRHSRIPHRCDTRKQCRSGDHKRERRRAF